MTKWSNWSRCWAAARSTNARRRPLPGILPTARPGNSWPISSESAISMERPSLTFRRMIYPRHAGRLRKWAVDRPVKALNRHLPAKSLGRNEASGPIFLSFRPVIINAIGLPPKIRIAATAACAFLRVWQVFLAEHQSPAAGLISRSEGFNGKSSRGITSSPFNAKAQRHEGAKGDNYRRASLLPLCVSAPWSLGV